MTIVVPRLPFKLILIPKIDKIAAETRRVGQPATAMMQRALKDPASTKSNYSHIATMTGRMPS